MSCNAISGGETKVWRGGSRCPGLQSSRCQAGGGTGASPCLQGGQSLARPGSPVSTDCVWYSGPGRGWWGLLTRMKGDPFATLECSWSSALRLAFSRPLPPPHPEKEHCWGVLTVSSLPVVSGENSSFSEPSGLECPHDAVGLSAWLTHGGSERFLPVVRSGGWAWWSLRGCPVPKTPPGLPPPYPPPPMPPISFCAGTLVLLVGTKALGMWAFYGLRVQLPNREGLVNREIRWWREKVRVEGNT